MGSGYNDFHQKSAARLSPGISGSIALSAAGNTGLTRQGKFLMDKCFRLRRPDGFRQLDHARRLAGWTGPLHGGFFSLTFAGIVRLPFL